MIRNNYRCRLLDTRNHSDILTDLCFYYQHSRNSQRLMIVDRLQSFQDQKIDHLKIHDFRHCWYATIMMVKSKRLILMQCHSVPPSVQFRLCNRILQLGWLDYPVQYQNRKMSQCLEGGVMDLSSLSLSLSLSSMHSESAMNFQLKVLEQWKQVVVQALVPNETE